MGRIPAVHSAGRPCGEIHGHRNSSGSLRDNAGRVLLSIAGDLGDRYLSSSAKDEGQRDRSVLAQLIASVAPKDADLLSAKLLDEFGSVGRVLSQTEEAQRRVTGSSAVVRLLAITKETLLVSLQNDIPRTLISATDQSLIKYLRASMGSLTTETMRILFLDPANRLIRDEETGSGSPNRILVQPRSILKRALELNASAIIMVHNHPGGNVEPSQSDLRLTRSIEALGRELEVKLHDHIIIAGNQWTSFRKKKLL